MSDSEETVWDPISSSGRVMPPSDFVLDSFRSSFSQTKKSWPERLLPRPSTPQTLTHNNVKFIFFRTSPLKQKLVQYSASEKWYLARARWSSVCAAGDRVGSGVTTRDLLANTCRSAAGLEHGITWLFIVLSCQERAWMPVKIDHYSSPLLGRKWLTTRLENWPRLAEFGLGTRSSLFELIIDNLVGYVCCSFLWNSSSLYLSCRRKQLSEN